MRKLASTLIFLFIITVSPLIFKPELLLNYKMAVIYIGGLVIFLTQPAFNVQETLNNKVTDKFSILFILIASGISISGSIIEWAYFGNITTNVFITILGIVMIIFGLAVRISAINTLGKYFTATARSTAQHILIKTGPYSIVRHPSYIGAIIALIGVPVFLNNVLTPFLTVLLLSVVYSMRIKNEDKLLINMFGEEYIRYAVNVKAIIPYIW
jgi:protein-S-isoprenylcysteine O-methyltransferase Ste14